jgi:hypothetical protein
MSIAIVLLYAGQHPVGQRSLRMQAARVRGAAEASDCLSPSEAIADFVAGRGGRVVIGMSTEDLASIAGLVIFVILAILLFGGLSFWLYRRVCERSMILNVPPSFRDIWGEKVTIKRDERPILYWSLMAFYAAILLGITASMIVPLLSGLPLLFGMTK